MPDKGKSRAALRVVSVRQDATGRALAPAQVARAETDPELERLISALSLWESKRIWAQRVPTLFDSRDPKVLTPTDWRIFVEVYLDGIVAFPERLTGDKIVSGILGVVENATEEERSAYIDATQAPISETSAGNARAAELRDLANKLKHLRSDTGTSLHPVITWKPDRKRRTLAIDHYLANFGHLPREALPYSDEVRRANFNYWTALRGHQRRLGRAIDDLFPVRPEARGGSRFKLAKVGAADNDPAEELARRRAQARDHARAARERQKPKASPS